MNIIIAGDGKVGSTLARQLSAEGYDITLIDSNQEVLEASVERYDVMGCHGNCASMAVLQQAGVSDAQLLIAATSEDEVNLLCCITARALNPNLHTIARIRNPEYSDQIYGMRDTFGLSMTVNPEKQAALEMERLLKYPGFLKRDSFAQGRAEIVELRIDSGSRLCNVPLMDIGSVVKCRILVCAVLRSGTAIAPNGSFVLREGDRIFVTAPAQNLTILLKNLGIITRRVRRVLICGGGRVSYYLASLLEKDNISAMIVEKNRARCETLTGQLPRTTVIEGDCTEQSLLEEQGLGGCDALVTLTGMDELNIIVSLYGSSRGVPLVITKMGKSDSRPMLDNLSIGSIICPKELCCNSIVRYVRAMQNQTGAAVSVHTIADGQVEAVEFQVEDDNKFCGVPLKQLKLRDNVLIASIIHTGVTEIPGGDSVFHPGDTLVVVSSGRGVLRQFKDIFA